MMARVFAVALMVSSSFLAACHDDDPDSLSDYDYDDDDDDRDRSRYGIDICGDPDSYYRSECRTPEFRYEITRNEERSSSDGRRSSSGNRNDDDDHALPFFWGRKGFTYRWEAKFLTKDDNDEFSRQMRFVVREDELPPPITLPSSSRSSKSVSFDVDLQDSVPDPEDPDDDTRYIDIEEWLEDNARGEIEVEVQDITYCKLQNRINRDVPSSQVDCDDEDEDETYFRSTYLSIPYHMNCYGHSDKLFNHITKPFDATPYGPYINIVKGFWDILKEDPCH